jgi:hypothetical protein
MSPAILLAAEATGIRHVRVGIRSADGDRIIRQAGDQHEQDSRCGAIFHAAVGARALRGNARPTLMAIISTSAFPFDGSISAFPEATITQAAASRRVGSDGYPGREGDGPAVR